MDNNKITLSDTIGYLVFGNPVSQAAIYTISGLAKSVGITAKKTPLPAAPAPPLVLPLWRMAGSDYNWVRLAGLSGAAAVAMSAFCKKRLALIDDLREQAEAKSIFDTANRFHFIHAIALLAIPVVRNPKVTGSLLVTGTVLFSGSMYYRALTGDKSLVQVATCGGFCLLAAWLSLMF